MAEEPQEEWINEAEKRMEKLILKIQSLSSEKQEEALEKLSKLLTVYEMGLLVETFKDVNFQDGNYQKVKNFRGLSKI